MNILDLGCAPGSWCQVLAEQVFPKSTYDNKVGNGLYKISTNRKVLIQIELICYSIYNSLLYMLFNFLKNKKIFSLKLILFSNNFRKSVLKIILSSGWPLARSFAWNLGIENLAKKPRT